MLYPEKLLHQILMMEPYIDNNKNFYINTYQKIIKIREFESMLLKLFEKGILTGTTHTALGQEIIAVLVLNNLSANDHVISNHRCHAHFLSMYDKYDEFLNELIGDKKGICKGRAGSQHIHYKNFYANGILGNLLPVSAGIALSLKHQDLKNGIVHIFLGDGVFGQGVLYETLNFVSLKKLKCLFIVENNKIAQTTKIEDNLAGSIKKRFDAFGIDNKEMNVLNSLNFFLDINKIKQQIHDEEKPYAIIVDTVRLGAHSKGDDTRSQNEIEEIKMKDPILNLQQKINKSELNEINSKTKEFINELLTRHKLFS